MRHAYGDLLVLAEDHLRHDVGAIVHERVVQPAVARAGIQRGVRNLELLQQVDDDVRAVLLRYLPTPRFSASVTNESSNAFVTSRFFTAGFVADSVSFV